MKSRSAPKAAERARSKRFATPKARARSHSRSVLSARHARAFLLGWPTEASELILARAISGEVTLVRAGGDYRVSVPLETRRLKPAAGQEVLADVGILRGREGRTMQRVHWNNLDTVIVSDLPS